MFPELLSHRGKFVVFTWAGNMSPAQVSILTGNGGTGGVSDNTNHILIY